MPILSWEPPLCIIITTKEGGGRGGTEAIGNEKLMQTLHTPSNLFRRFCG